jgi:hypothetical protein
MTIRNLVVLLEFARIAACAQPFADVADGFEAVQHWDQVIAGGDGRRWLAF